MGFFSKLGLKLVDPLGIIPKKANFVEQAYDKYGDKIDKLTDPLDITGERKAEEARKAAEEAANAQANSAQNARTFQQEMFDKQRANQEPWRMAGVNALGEIQSGIQSGRFDLPKGEFNLEDDEEYQRRLREGNAFATSGMRHPLSAQQQQGMKEYNRGYATNELDNAYNRYIKKRNLSKASLDTSFNQLAVLAGIGQTATTQTAGNLQNLGASNTKYSTAIADAQSQGAYNSAKARSSGYAQFANAANRWGENYLMAKGNK
jgi:hypothetical protein